MTSRTLHLMRLRGSENFRPAGSLHVNVSTLAMMRPPVSKRLVFHIGGYDPYMPPEVAYARFARELKRFEKTWSAKASVSPLTIAADQATWDITTTGANWRVATSYWLVRWDDIIESLARQPWWLRIIRGQLAWIDFAIAGALWSYLRINWRYALFFIFPFAICDAFALIAWFVGVLLAEVSGSLWIGIAAGLLMCAALLKWPWRWLGLATLFDDWIFSSSYVRSSHPILEQRLDVIARQIDAAARNSHANEILLVGHSFGAVIAVDLLDRVLRLNPSIGENGPRVAFLSVGSSILKIGLHRGAKRFRASLQRVALAPGIFWAEYQTLTDVMNFYKTNPISELGLTADGRPVVRHVRIRDMLDPESYRRIRRHLYRVHSQFVSGNERRTAYDYFMLVCGPLLAQQQVELPHGAASAIEESGALIDAWSDKDPDRESESVSQR